MIARDIIVSFHIYSLLKYDKIYGKFWRKILFLANNVIYAAFCGGYYQVWFVKFMLVFYFMTHFSSRGNIWNWNIFWG